MRNHRSHPFVLLAFAVLALASCTSQPRGEAPRTSPPPSSAPSASCTTIILVRHAEKFKDPGNPRDPNPPLSPEGHARAEKLALLLADAGVDTVFTSDLDRTKQTAAPLIEQTAARGAPVAARVYAAGSTPPSIAQQVRDLGGGHVILVVGHSNHIAPILKQLGGWTVPEMGESDFDDIYVVTLRDGGQSRLLRAAYPHKQE